MKYLTKIEMGIVVAIFIILGLIIAPNYFLYERDMARSKIRYIYASFRHIQIHFYKQDADISNYILPEQLPIEIPLDGFLITPTLQLADPYNEKNIDGEERIRVKVEQVHEVEETPDFNYYGNSYRYERFNNRSALIYSYGPDRDDDFKNIPLKSLESAMSKTTGSFTLWTKYTSEVITSVYDPSNGALSNGDLFLIIDLYSKR